MEKKKLIQKFEYLITMNATKIRKLKEANTCTHKMMCEIGELQALNSVLGAKLLFLQMEKD